MEPPVSQVGTSTPILIALGCHLSHNLPNMSTPLSPRLLEIANALPLKPGTRVLEIGCGPGAMARYIATHRNAGHVLAIDRSPKATAAAQASIASMDFTTGLEFRCVAIEDFELQPGEAPYDLAVAIRVGALDGRHPEAGKRAMVRVAATLQPEGRLFIDGGDPLKEIALPR